MKKKRILIVEDEKDLLYLLDLRLSSAGYEVSKTSSGENVLEMVKKVIPDLILLDIMLPGTDGFKIKEELNKNTSTASIPVIFLTAKSSIPNKIKGLHLGADDYVTKPFNADELLARIASALARRNLYEEISMTDGLTGLRNINFFKRQISLFFNIAKRYKKLFSLAVIDIDKLKQINDEYGHMTGDFVLKKFSIIAKETLRKSDIIARYGGDEFVVIMPETNDKQANKAIERLKTNVKNRVFSVKDSKKDLPFSISAGIATYDNNIKDESQIFELADKKLYKDKKQNK